jgi:C-terminal processing protease CtpA/Prc
LLGIQSDSLENGRGCEITSVHPDSAANKAGLRRGDIITKIDDTEIRTFKEFSGFIIKKSAGDKIVMSLTRNGTKLSKEVTLANWKLYHVRDFSQQASSFGVNPEFCPGKYTKYTEASGKKMPFGYSELLQLRK